MEQHQEQHSATVSEEYLDAQRAAVEAVEVGRATLEEANRQGEQLSYAQKLADDTRYALDKSARLLRGMTWSGWAQNLLSKDVQRPKSRDNIEYQEEVPPFAQSAAQSIQNYQANLAVLQACESNEQRQTSKSVCDDMFRVASDQIERLRKEDNPKVVRQLSFDLQRLRRWQSDILQQHRAVQQNGVRTPNQNSSGQKTTPGESALSSIQDDHLNFLSGNLEELNTMALTLNETFSTQARIVDSLEERTEENYEKTKMMSRRAGRMAQKKSWGSPKKSFDKWVTVKHINTGRYIADTNGSLSLVDDFDDQTCVFGVWKRPSGLFGLRSKHSSRFVGQTLLGSLACTASSFGQREEWEADECWDETRLLCASANWGAGGYLTVTPRDGFKFLKIEDKVSSPVWCLAEIHDPR